MLEKDLVYESFKDKDKVCESYIWCVFLEKLNSLNKDSQISLDGSSAKGFSIQYLYLGKSNRNTHLQEDR